VLLPSFAGTAMAWRLNIEGLSAHYRTYAVDVIGQPGKSIANRRIRNRQQLAAWLSDVLDGLNVDHASLVGCSFGGFLALNQALMTPERIERAVLISPVGTFSSQFWKLVYAMMIKGTVRKLLRRVKGSKLAPSMADLGMTPKDVKWAALMAVTMSEAPKVGIIRPTVFTNAQLRAIRVPTLLLIGEHERMYQPHALLQLAQQRMPQLQGAIVDDADHIAAMAQPADVNDRILQFLRQPRP
jgi:pimeloyl-ACP methyl ester carboxylesterase